MADKTVTVGPAKTYASLQAALVGEQDDLTDAAYYSGGPGRLIIECYNFADTTKVSTLGQTWVTSASYYVLVKAMEDHGGKYSTGAYRLEPTGSDYALLVDADPGPHHLYLQGLQVNITGTSERGIIGGTGIGSGWIKIEKCIVFGDSGSSHGLYFSDQNTEVYIWNTIIYGLTGTDKAGIFSNGSIAFWIYNCTIDDCDVGINPASGVEIFKNTRITNCVSVDGGEGIGADSNYNLTDGTAPTNWGANSIDSSDTPTIDYVDDDNADLTLRDYHLKSTSDGGYGAAVDLSGDSAIAVTDDIDGTTRSSWDIGADEYEAATGGEGGSAPMISVFATAIQRAATW